MDRVNGQDYVDIGGGRRGFRSQNKLAGLPGTEVTAAFLNGVQEELMALVEKTGQAPDGENWLQVARSVRSQQLNYFVAGGSENALAITMDPAPADWAELIGVPLHVLVASPNTGAMTLAVAGLGGTKPIVWPGGLALKPSAMRADDVASLMYNGTSMLVIGGAWQPPGDVNNAPIYPEILVNFGRFTVTTAVGLVTIDAGQPWQHRGLKTYSTDAFSAAPGLPNSRAFVTAANKTYHAVWDAPGTGLAVPLETYPDGKMTLVDMTGASPAEDDPSYDTTFDHMLHLKVVTDGANNPTVTRLFNRHTLTAAGDKQTITRGTSWGSTSTGLTSTPNWSRTPQISLRYFSADVEPVFEAVDWVSVVANRYAYTAYCGGYITDPSYQPTHFVNGKISVSLRA